MIGTGIRLAIFVSAGGRRGSVHGGDEESLQEIELRRWRAVAVDGRSGGVRVREQVGVRDLGAAGADLSQERGHEAGGGGHLAGRHRQLILLQGLPDVGRPFAGGVQEEDG